MLVPERSPPITPRSGVGPAHPLVGGSAGGTGWARPAEVRPQHDGGGVFEIDPISRLPLNLPAAGDVCRICVLRAAGPRLPIRPPDTRRGQLIAVTSRQAAVAVSATAPSTSPVIPPSRRDAYSARPAPATRPAATATGRIHSTGTAATAAAARIPATVAARTRAVSNSAAAGATPPAT